MSTQYKVYITDTKWVSWIFSSLDAANSCLQEMKELGYPGAHIKELGEDNE